VLVRLLLAEQPQADLLLLHDPTRRVLPARATLRDWATRDSLVLVVEFGDLLEFELARSQSLLDVIQVGADPTLARQGAIIFIRLYAHALSFIHAQVRSPVQD